MNGKFKSIATTLAIFLLSLFILFNLYANYYLLEKVIGVKSQNLLLLKEMNDRKIEIVTLHKRQQEIIKMLDLMIK